MRQWQPNVNGCAKAEEQGELLCDSGTVVWRRNPERIFHLASYSVVLVIPGVIGQ